MPRALLSWVLLFLLGPWVCAPAIAALPPAQPNFVFILIDDMGWTDGGCFGSKFYRTPHIDRLAADGMQFTQAYASCAVCSPTRAAILTGKAPARLHLTDWIPGEGTPAQSRFSVPVWQQYLSLNEVTIARALQGRGYVTASIGKWHLGGPAYFPQHQGFDLNVAGGETGHPTSYFWPYGGRGAVHRVPGLADRGGRRGEYLTDRLTDEALKFIQANQTKPFFLYLSHYAVHAPLMAKEPFIERYEERPGSNGQSNAVYAAMIQSVDESVGRIIKKLEDLRLSDRTVIIFTSDNGGAVHFGDPPATSNAPLRLGKGYAYEGGLRVPLLVKVPWMTRRQSRCDVPVISHDFFPTLLELAGGTKTSTPPGLDGLSLVPLLRGQTRLPRDGLFWHYPHFWLDAEVTPYSVARVGDWKLIRFYETQTEELYNLHDDLGETKNLAKTSPEKRQELARRLDAWLQETGAQMPVPR